jgi:hypothetical protein
MESSGQCLKYDGETTETAPARSEAGVFVKGCLKFIVTDDLQVAPASTSLMMSLFQKFGVQDPAVLEQQVLEFRKGLSITMIQFFFFCSAPHPLLHPFLPT